MKRGFTLVEIMVSLAILALILVTISGLYSSSVRMRNTASELTVRARLGNALLEAVRKDLDHLAVYPGRRAAYFSLETDRDGSGNRRDRLSFDALVPFTTEEGNVVLRFGRITYTAEGQLDEKKLTRTTVFINDEYDAEEKGKEAEEPAPDEKPKKEDAKKDSEAAEELEDLDLERGEEMTVLARNVVGFGIDIPSEKGGEWEEEDLKGRVPAAVRIALVLEIDEDEENGEIVNQEFESIFMPIMAQHVANRYNPGGQDEKPGETDRADDKPSPAGRSSSDRKRIKFRQ